MLWPQYAEVKCRGCGKEYVCTPQDDYYNYEDGPGTGVCFRCLLIENNMDPDKTPVLVIDEYGKEVDPRDE